MAEVPRPQGRYAPAVVHDGVAYSAGMTPRVDGALVVTGRVGAEVSLDRACDAASIATRNALAAVAELGPVRRCLRMTVYVAAVDGFAAHSQVADGASEALAAEGLTGFARSAVGVASLPGGAPVEVELVVAIGP